MNTRSKTDLTSFTIQELVLPHQIRIKPKLRILNFEHCREFPGDIVPVAVFSKTKVHDLIPVIARRGERVGDYPVLKFFSTQHGYTLPVQRKAKVISNHRQYLELDEQLEELKVQEESDASSAATLPIRNSTTFTPTADMLPIDVNGHSPVPLYLHVPGLLGSDTIGSTSTFYSSPYSPDSRFGDSGVVASFHSDKENFPPISG